MASLYGCDAFKSEDDKIKDTLIGKFYEEDHYDDEGNKIKNIKGAFYKDGKFRIEYTFEYGIDEQDVTLKIKGKWNVKEKFIYYKYDNNSVVITPEIYMLGKDEVIKSLQDENTPDKVINYDASKIIYEDSDGKRRTMKKTY
jgi:hypothetical protein